MTDSHKYEEACEAILGATKMLVGSMGNAQEMVRQAKKLAEGTSVLVRAIKVECNGQMDPDAKQRLHDAAKNLAEATSCMVEAAKVPRAHHCRITYVPSYRVLLVHPMTQLHKKLSTRQLRVCAWSLML